MAHLQSRDDTLGKTDYGWSGWWKKTGDILKGGKADVDPLDYPGSYGGGSGHDG